MSWGLGSGIPGPGPQIQGPRVQAPRIMTHGFGTQDQKKFYFMLRNFKVMRPQNLPGFLNYEIHTQSIPHLHIFWFWLTHGLRMSRVGDAGAADSGASGFLSTALANATKNAASHWAAVANAYVGQVRTLTSNLGAAPLLSLTPQTTTYPWRTPTRC